MTDAIVEPKKIIEAVLWYQEDARTEYAWADKYRGDPKKDWIAARVQVAAAVSSQMARRLMGVDE